MFRPARKKEDTSDIAARHFATQKLKSTGRERAIDEDLKCIVNNEMLMDAMKLPQGTSLQSTPLRSAMKIPNTSEKKLQAQNSDRKGRSTRADKNIRIESITQRLSKQVDFKEQRERVKLVKPTLPDNSFDDQKLILNRLLRQDRPKEPVEIPVEELKAEIDRKNKLKSKLKERQKLLEKVNLASRDELSAEIPKTDFALLENELNETPGSPARFHPRPEIEVFDEDSPLVKLKRGVKADFKLNSKLLLHQVRVQKKSGSMAPETSDQPAE